MLTILHAADLHLDSPFSGLAPELAARRRSEQRLLLDDLARLARESGADLVLLSGDLLDRRHIYPATLQALHRCLEEMACPVFIAPGNHDPYTPDSVYATRCWPENVHIFKGAVEKVALPRLSCAVYGAGFTGSHQTRSPLEGFCVEDHELLNLGCFHADLSEGGHYGPITPGQMAASGLDYLALGHIHSHSGLNNTGGTIWAYPGCPQGRGFDETGEKGVLLLRAEPGRVEGRFIPLCRHRYESLTVDLTGREAITALEELLPPPNTDTACRVTLTGEWADPDLPALHARFAPSFAQLTLRDETTLPRSLWARRGEDTLTGAVLELLWQQCQAQPENETLQLAARYALAALEGGEDIAP